MNNTIELDDRISKCQKVLDGDPNSQIFAALAEAYRKKGELDKAFNICKDGLRIHHKYGSAHLVMAKINLDRGLYDWAELELKKAADIDGRTRAVEILLAEIYIYKGEFNNAIKLLKQMTQADPLNQQVKNLLEIAMKIPEEQTIVMSKAEKADSIAPVAGADTDAGGKPELEKVEKIKEPATPKEIIERGCQIHGINGALFINYEGLVAEMEWTLSMNPESCAAQLVSIGDLLNNELKPKSFGKVKTILIETGSVTFYQVYKPEGIYVFLAEFSSKLGSIRMKIENLLENN